MDLISFDALRTLRLPPHTVLKPEHFFRHTEALRQADWVLFPEYWQVNALVYGLGARIFPSQATYLIGHDKVEMSRAFEVVAAEHLPYTLIRPNEPWAAEEVWDEMSLPFVAKIPRSSMGEGVFEIARRADWTAYLARTEVIYAQEMLPIDRDLRLVVLGDEVVGGYWRLQSPDGFHNNIARGGQYMPGPIPEAARALVERVSRTLGVDHAGFDVAMVGDHPFLLEFNRLFGNQGIEALMGDLTPKILAWLERGGRLDPDRPRTPRGPRTPPRSRGHRGGRGGRPRRVA